jgi:dihydroorotase
MAPEHEVLLAGGVVHDGERFRPGDVLVVDGVVRAVGPELARRRGQRVVACDGRVVAPAFVDLHVHLRFPGSDERDTPEAIAEAALRGGVTLAVAMANTDPPIDSAARLLEASARFEGLAIEVVQAACMTLDRRGETPVDVAELVDAGAEVLSDDGSGVASAAVMREVMRLAEAYGVVLAQHAEEPSLAHGGVLNEGPVAEALGVGGAPEVAESVMVARDLELAKVVPVPLHLCHVSARESLGLLRAARREGMRVSCEVTPHHLLLDETAAAGGDVRFKVNPPLRSRATQMALRQAVLRGEVDAIASDHAPHPPSRKERPLAEAAFGMVGVAELFPAAWTALRHAPGAPSLEGLPEWLTPEEWGALGQVLRALTTGPAGVLGRERVLEVGAQVDVVVLDPNRPPAFAPGSLYRSSNCPYRDLALEGRVEAVLRRGELHVWG